MDTFHLLVQGSASASSDELTEEEFAAHREERDATLARKRPAGFAPWPEDRP